MENLTFASSAEFLAWLDNLSNDPAQRERFDRVPVDRQFWSYGDGHIAGMRAGLRGGTLLANLRLMRSTGSGALDHARDLRLVEDIDRRGGVVFTFGWPPQ